MFKHQEEVLKQKKLDYVFAGSTTLLADMLNMRLPIEAHVLQACVSEPVKPLLHQVVTFWSRTLLL